VVPDPDTALRRLTWTAQSEPQLVRLALDVLNSLDGMLDAPIEERLAVVAARAGECVGAAAFCVSRVDGMTVHERRLVVSRAPRAEPGTVAVERPGTYQLAQRPGVAQAAEGSAFSVTLDTGDPVEQAALKAAGFRSAVVAGGYDPDAHRWLIELHGDEFTHGTASFAAILFTLVQAALGFPRAVTPPRTTT